MTLSGRLSLVLCAIAALSTGLALIPQELALPSDLERAARARLAKSAAAADQLLEAHVSAVKERFRSISMTPEFRANLQTGHLPTLQFFADRLAAEQGSALVAFVDRSGHVSVHSGPIELLQHTRSSLPAELPEAEVALVADFGGTPFATVLVPLRTNERVVGALVAVEAIQVETVAAWSRLCGAQVDFQERGSPGSSELMETVRLLGDLELQVGATLDAERAALSNARQKLLSGGAVALALAFAFSLFLARGLVRPIRAIQKVTEPFGRGEFGARLSVDRQDEIGDVSRAFNLMADRLETSQLRLLNAQRLARLGNWSLEPSSRGLRVSGEVLRIYGLTIRDESLNEQDLIERIHPDDRQRFRIALERCIKDGTPFHLDHRTVDARGTERFAHTRGEAVGDAPVRIEGTVQDITDRKLIEEQVRYLADYDSLTGLANRRLFREHLDLAIAEAARSDTRLAVIFLDIDGFKYVNDTFGHSVGDELLRVIAQRLSEIARSVGRGRSAASASVARLGGDEFTLLRTGIDDPQAAGKMALAVLRALAEPVTLGGHEIALGGSLGIAIFPEDGEDSETLLRNCDTAMYHAKSQGRNGYQFYSESMNAVVFKRLVLENKLRRAIDDDQLVLYFQPKIGLAELRVEGFEALVRWHDADLGNVPPSDFIPLAEETGLIGAIGDWVLRRAVRQVGEWQATALAGLRVSVNLSGRELMSSAALRIGNILREEQVDPGLLELEITETAVISGDVSAVQALEGLRDLGIHIALDDFGTGYSSLSYLRSLPIDTLKIDQSFVRNVEDDGNDAALLGAIVSMAKVLKLRVVAEGVETEGQFELLRELHCDEVQGYLFGAAMSPDRIVRSCQEINERLCHKRKDV